MAEKIVRSLQDLEDALALAAGQGECRIKVGNKVAVLVASDSLSDQQADEFLNRPAVVQRLDKAARSLEEGRGISHADVFHSSPCSPVPGQYRRSSPGCGPASR